jgi:hypothetical protein
VKRLLKALTLVSICSVELYCGLSCAEQCDLASPCFAGIGLRPQPCGCSARPVLLLRRALAVALHAATVAAMTAVCCVPCVANNVATRACVSCCGRLSPRRYLISGKDVNVLVPMADLLNHNAGAAYVG